MKNIKGTWETKGVNIAPIREIAEHEPKAIPRISVG